MCVCVCVNIVQTATRKAHCVYSILLRLLVLRFVVYSLVGRSSVLTANPLQTNAFYSSSFTIVSEHILRIGIFSPYILILISYVAPYDIGVVHIGRMTNKVQLL